MSLSADQTIRFQTIFIELARIKVEQQESFFCKTTRRFFSITKVTLIERWAVVDLHWSCRSKSRSRCKDGVRALRWWNDRVKVKAQHVLKKVLLLLWRKVVYVTKTFILFQKRLCRPSNCMLEGACLTNVQAWGYWDQSRYDDEVRFCLQKHQQSIRDFHLFSFFFFQSLYRCARLRTDQALMISTQNLWMNGKLKKSCKTFDSLACSPVRWSFQ